MKILYFSSILLLSIASCDKEQGTTGSETIKPQSGKTSQQASLPALTPQSVSFLRAELNALVLTRTSSGLVTDDSLSKLIAQAPKMLELGVLIDVIAALPDEQLPAFKTHIIDSLKRLAPQRDQSLNPKYEDTLRLAQRLHSSDVAALVFEHLQLAPTYEFPAAPLPNGWGGDAVGAHLTRGVQGLIASTVVESGDTRLMNSYRAELSTVSPKLQRVMIWAMGKSPDIADFELLWSMRSKINDPSVRDTLTRALNAIPVSMERVGRYPEGRQANRSEAARADLEQMATQCRQRLQQSNLVVALTMWD